MKNLIRRAIPVLLVVALFATYGLAQSATTGDLAGIVSDASGAVVANASLTLKDPGTNETLKQTSNAQGQYRFSQLKPGNYVLTATAAGMQSATINVTVNLGQVGSVPVKLGVAGTSTTVEVTGAVPLLQTEDANLSTSFSESQISQLPNPGNDITAYAYSAPGVVLNTGSGYGNFSAFGLPSTANLFTTNGNDNMDPYLNLNNSGASNLALGANELSEVAVVNNGYTAEYGRQAGTQMNASTLSGTNQFHGNALYWWNGRALNANEYFLKGSEVAAGTPNVRSFANNNQWAARIGGPIIKNKLFFFADTEGLRYVLPGAGGAVWIPTTQFANYTLANVNTTTPGSLPFYQNIFNLYSSAPGASRAVAATPSDDPFLGCGAASQALGGINGFGALTVDANGNPTSWGTPCAQQFRSTQNNLNTEWLMSVRIDYNISNTDKLNGRFRTDHGIQATGTDPINPAFNANSVQPEFEGQINEVHTFGNNAVNNFIVSGMWYQAIFGPANFANALKTFPTEMQFSDGLYSTLGGADYGYPQGRIVTQYMFTDNFTWTKGRHTMTFGANFRRNLVSDYTALSGISGLYTIGSMLDFSNGTFDPNNSTYAQVFPKVGAVQVKLYNLGMYAQDQWKVTSKLNLTLALRVDNTGNPGCKQDCFNRFVAPFNSLVHDVTVPYNQVIKTGGNQAFQSLQSLAWGPRVGVAYNLYPNTVIRGGFGLFSDLAAGFLADRFLTNTPNTFTASALGLGPISFDVPGNPRAQSASSSVAFQQGFANGATLADLQNLLGANFAPPTFQNQASQIDIPIFMEWNTQIEQQLGKDYSLSVNYVGNHGYNLMTIDPFSNAYCKRDCVNGFFGTPSQGLIPAGIASTDERFQQVNSLYNQGYSNYNGVTTTFKMRYGSQFQANFNYTWSHALDTCSNNCLLPFTANNVVSIRYTTSPLLPGTAYGNSDYDVRQNFSANYVWNIKSNWHNAFENAALGGWVLAGTIFYHSGYPWSPVNTSVRSNLGNVTPLRNGTPLGYFVGGLINQGGCGDPNIPCQTQDQFLQNSSNSTPQSNFGDIARGTFHGPGYFDTDMNITKNFKIRERMNFAIGANFFNLFNHPNFDLPVNSITSGSFGHIVDTVEPATTPYGAFSGVTLSGRIIQLNARFSF